MVFSHLPYIQRIKSMPMKKSKIKTIKLIELYNNNNNNLTYNLSNRNKY